MGMFDRIYDADGNEWQTKAYWCELVAYRVGDQMPDVGTADYQVEIMGPRHAETVDSYATVLGGILMMVDASRADRLPLLGCFGEFAAEEKAHNAKEHRE